MSISKASSGSLRTHKLIVKSSYKFSLTARNSAVTLEHLYSLLETRVLQEKLGERGERRFALGVYFESFAAECFGTDDILLPLVQGETLVYQRERVHGFQPEPSKGMPTTIESLLLAFERNSLVKLLDRLIELALIQQQFTTIPISQTSNVNTRKVNKPTNN